MYRIIKAIMYQTMDETMYDKIDDIMMLVIASIMSISGLIMLVAPRLGVKKSVIDDPSALMRIRAFGLVMTTSGILMLIASIEILKY